MSGGGGAIADPKVQEQLLAEEEQAMAKYKEQAKATGNPFAAASSATGINTGQIFFLVSYSNRRISSKSRTPFIAKMQSFILRLRWFL